MLSKLMINTRHSLPLFFRAYLSKWSASSAISWSNHGPFSRVLNWQQQDFPFSTYSSLSNRILICWVPLSLLDLKPAVTLMWNQSAVSFDLAGDHQVCAACTSSICGGWKMNHAPVLKALRTQNAHSELCLYHLAVTTGRTSPRLLLTFSPKLCS